MQLRMRFQSIDPATRFSGRKNLHSAASAFGLLLLLLTSALATQLLHAQGYQDLHDLGASGCCPSPSLMAQGRDGNVYGTTATGGTSSKGTIFKISPAGGYTTLFNFDGTHGATPVGGLTLGNDGNLYGTAEFGGANAYGTIFKITPAGAMTVLYNFTGNSTGIADGGYPVSPLIIGNDGNFYGTSYPYYAFKMSPTGVFTPITRIPGITLGPLLQARNGSFYGTTQFQGTHGGGTIYKITGTTATTIHNFDSASGSFPVGGLVEGTDGNLYGTTTAGGTDNAGVIYRITPAGVYTMVISFDNVHTLNGYEADAGLIVGADGNLYGATVWGGQFGYGVIFSMSTSGAYTALYSFNAPSGDGAYATPIQHTNGRIYGTTTRGGSGGMGVIYGFADGLAPFARLMSTTGIVGKAVGILGRGFSSASSVTFNGAPASFHVLSDTFMTATVPSGETGFVTVDTTSGNLTSSKIFRVTPQMTGFSPAAGKVGDTVQITGAGLIQASSITVGGVAVTTYTVHSDGLLSFAVPAAAKTGTIAVTTPGGKAVSKTMFTVTK